MSKPVVVYFAALLPESKVLPPKAFSGLSIKSSVKALEEFAADRLHW